MRHMKLLNGKTQLRIRDGTAQWNFVTQLGATDVRNLIYVGTSSYFAMMSVE
jgi:hypothetical protein